MSLTVGTDSYITVADANTYIGTYLDSTDWDGASDANKEKMLKRATHYLDLVYGPRLQGVKTDYDQALMWPRFNVADYDGNIYDSDEYPVGLQRAVCEMAVRYLEGEYIPLEDQEDTAAIKREKVKVDVIENDIEYVGGMRQGAIFPIVDKLMREFIKSRSSISLKRV